MTRSKEIALRALLAVAVVASTIAAATAQNAASTSSVPLIKAAPSATDEGHQVYRLYPGVAPGSEGWTQKEVDFGNPGSRGVRNVVDPTITVYLPDSSTPATGAGVIIAPGGGFR